MGKFNEVLDSFGDAVEGIYSVPEDIVSQLVSAYDEDFAVPASELAAAHEANAQLNSEIAALKEMNSTLLANVAASANVAGGDANDEGDPEGEDDPTDISIDDLFEQ